MKNHSSWFRNYLIIGLLALAPHSQCLLIPPANISVVLISWSPPAIRVSWDFDSNSLQGGVNSRFSPRKMDAFRISYHPIHSKYRVIQELSPLARNVTLDRLTPSTEYLLEIFPIFQDEPVANASHSIRFVSPDNEPSRFLRNNYRPLVLTKEKVDINQVTVRPEEIIIVGSVLIAWLAIIGIFIKKWGRIRTLEPCSSLFTEELLIEGGLAKKTSSDMNPGSNSSISKNAFSESAKCGFVKRSSSRYSTNSDTSNFAVASKEVNARKYKSTGQLNI